MKASESFHLEQASNALFQDKEAYRAVGEAWPEGLKEAHAAIRRAIHERSERKPEEVKR